MTLKVYRADLPRTLVLVAALLVTAAATGVFARQFRVGVPQNRNPPALIGGTVPPIHVRAMAGIGENAARDAATTELPPHHRRVE